MSRTKGDGLGRLGGRKKGTPNKLTTELRDKIGFLLEGNDAEFMERWHKCDPKDFCNIYLQLMKYVLPQLSSITLDDQSKTNTSTIEMLIRLRDGDKNVNLENLNDEES